VTQNGEREFEFDWEFFAFRGRGGIAAILIYPRMTLVRRLQMRLITPGIFAVMRRFPERKRDIQRFFKEDLRFRTLCDDYGRCAEALGYWNQFTSEETAGYRQDYTELVRELESEIEKLIENGGT
jgi:hypothetical protein